MLGGSGGRDDGDEHHLGVGAAGTGTREVNIPCEGEAEGSIEAIFQRLYEKEQAGTEGEELPGGDELPAGTGRRRWGLEHRERGEQLGRQAQPPRDAGSIPSGGSYAGSGVTWLHL